METGYADTYDRTYDELEQTVGTPLVGHQRTAPDGTRLLPSTHPVGGAYDQPPTRTTDTRATTRTRTPPTPAPRAPPAATRTTRPGTPTTPAAG